MSAHTPESIQLATSDLCSIPMLYMGKREANVKLLKNKRLNALKENRDKIDVVIDL